jgi:hypothetical protein
VLEFAAPGASAFAGLHEREASVTAASVNLAKVALMLCASFGLFLAWALPRERRIERNLDAYFAVLGLLALFTYSQFGLFHQPHGYVHTWEMFNYYLPSKYFDELGYDGLYGAALAADWEAPEPYFAGIERARDLRSNAIVPADQLREDPAFRARFTPERWASFKRDLAYLQIDYGDDMWLRVLHDHGYNAPPSRTLFTRWIAAASGPATTLSMHAIALLDVPLLALLLATVWRTFGLRSAALVAVFLGTNSLAAFYWIGGSFLRFDWVVLLGCGLCALATRRYALAGALIGGASMLRVFPALFALGVLGRGVTVAVQSGRWPARYTAFVAGGAAAGALLGLASLTFVGGFETWQAWYTKIAAHLEPQFHNHIGLRGFLDFAPAALVLGRAAFGLLFLFCLPRVDDVRGALLGSALIYAFGFVTCYYWVFLMLLPLWLRREPVSPRAWLFTTALFLPSATAIALRAAQIPFQARYIWASVALLVPFALLFEWIWREPELAEHDAAPARLENV